CRRARAGWWRPIGRAGGPQMANSSNEAAPFDLLDHFVGAREKRWRDCEPERLGDLEVYDQLELCRLFDGKIGRLCPLQDPIHVGGGTPLDIKTCYAVRHQAAAITDPCRSSVHCRQFVAGRELTHFGAV